jgi:VIT1/CCC1 family predicted Fe2+/Mn2+ transporter
MFKSKRFVAFIVGVILFTLLVFLTSHPILEISGAVSMICGIYIGAQSLRGSSPEDIG